MINRRRFLIVATIGLFAFTARGISQDIRYAIHAMPVISWIGTDGSDYSFEGVRAGFSAGLNVFYYFNDNYAASTGISFLAAGGRQSATAPHLMVFNNFTQSLAPGDEMKYNLNYINIPLGVRLQTNQYGYITYFADIGLDARMMLKSTVDILAHDITHENASKEVNGFNAGWHVFAGAEYKLTLELSVFGGLGYDQDFFDITKDLKNVYQPGDRSGLRMLRFIFGIKF